MLKISHESSINNLKMLSAAKSRKCFMGSTFCTGCVKGNTKIRMKWCFKFDEENVIYSMVE